MTEKELILLIKVSEAKTDHFKLGRTLLIMFYHFIYFFFTGIIGVPVIYIIEGFDAHLLYNLRMLP